MALYQHCIGSILGACIRYRANIYTVSKRHQVALYQHCIGLILGASYTIPRQYPYCVQTTFGQYTTYTVALYQHCIGSILGTPYIRYWANILTVCKRLSHSIGPIHACIVNEYRYNIVPISHGFLGMKDQFSSVQFSFISAPPHEQNNKMLKSLCVVKDGVRKRKKQQNELTLCLAN